METVDPDINIALTYLEQPTPDPLAALRQLERYMGDGVPGVQSNAATPAYCRASRIRTDRRCRQSSASAGNKSPRWYAVWFELATLGAKDADAAADWLKRVEPSIGADATLLRIALAGAWEQVGQKFDSTTAHETALAQLKPITAKAPVPATAWWQWAIVNQSLANLVEAERGWDEYLKLNPKEPQGLNNLAYILFLDGDVAKLPRAEDLAMQAVAAYPDVSTFYDTLGRIEFRLGKTAGAIKNFRIALEKDPNDLDAMIGLADSLQSDPAGREEAPGTAQSNQRDGRRRDTVNAPDSQAARSGEERNDLVALTHPWLIGTNSDLTFSCPSHRRLAVGHTS